MEEKYYGGRKTMVEEELKGKFSKCLSQRIQSEFVWYKKSNSVNQWKEKRLKSMLKEQKYATASREISRIKDNY